MTIPFWTNLLIRTFAIGEVIRTEGLMNTALLRLQPDLAPDRAALHRHRRADRHDLRLPAADGPCRFLPPSTASTSACWRRPHDLYARRWQVLLRIVLPIVRPGIVAGSILVFVPSLGAYVTPRILGGGKNMMIGNFIELQFRAGPQLAAGGGTVDAVCFWSSWWR